jgi:hypothetical protein
MRKQELEGIVMTTRFIAQFKKVTGELVWMSITISKPPSRSYYLDVAQAQASYFNKVQFFNSAVFFTGLYRVLLNGNH